MDILSLICLLYRATIEMHLFFCPFSLFFGKGNQSRINCYFCYRMLKDNDSGN